MEAAVWGAAVAASCPGRGCSAGGTSEGRAGLLSDGNGRPPGVGASKSDSLSPADRSRAARHSRADCRGRPEQGMGNGGNGGFV